MNVSCFAWARGLCVILIFATTLNFSKSLTHDFMVAKHKRLLEDLKAPQPGNTSLQCLQDFQEFLYDPNRLIPAFDATGKIESGFFYGNWGWLGNFDQCRSIDDMQYCLAIVEATVSLDFGSGVVNYSRAEASESQIYLKWGVCTVDSCSEEDVGNSLNDIINAAGLADTLYVMKSFVFCARDPPIPYTSGYYVMVVVCCLLGALGIGGWFVAWHEKSVEKSSRPPQPPSENTPLLLADNQHERVQPLLNDQTQNNGEVKYISHNKGYSYFQRFLICFAINNNFSALTNTKQTSKSIRCLHGIRVISMSWVILGHSFLWPNMTNIVDNAPAAYTWFTWFSFQAISNATVSVDSFFFLSGLLVAYLAYFELEKRKGKFPWFKFYFHRFWRLTPVYMFVILIWIYLVPYMGQSPIWGFVLPRHNCKTYWWTNMLYINNFYPTNSQDMCIGWSWYLANDFQFYFVTPIILLTMYRSEIIGMIVTGCFLVASFIVTGVLYGYYEFTAQGAGGTDGASYFDIVYEKPYCRIAPYLVGLVMGYFLYKYKDVNFKRIPPTLTLVLSLVGWVLAASVALAVLYGLYPGTQGHVYSTFENVFYGTFARFAWSISLAWVVFACKYGMAGYVDDILSWDFWVPLSRLTYLGYLLHPIILDILVFNFANTFHYTINIIIFQYVAVLVVAFTAAGILYLLVENPLSNLEKLFEDKISKKQS